MDGNVGGGPTQLMCQWTESACLHRAKVSHIAGEVPKWARNPGASGIENDEPSTRKELQSSETPLVTTETTIGSPCGPTGPWAPFGPGGTWPALKSLASSEPFFTLTLVTALDGFSRTLAADQQNLGNAVNALYDDMGNLQEQLSQLNGELALQYGTFDTSGAEQTQADIQSTNDQLQQTQNLYSFCAQAGSGASSALQGLDYLAGYWGSVSTQAGQVVPILQQVSNDPASVVQLDLQAASQAWAQLLTLSQQTAGQFPATSTLMRTA